MKIKSGQSIVETIVAAALISMAVIAALSLMNHSQKQNSYAKSLAEATKYASQAVDWIRTERNSAGWATISAKTQTDASGGVASYCLPDIPFSGLDLATVTAGSCANTAYISGTNYIRELTIDPSQAGSGTLLITVKVRWLEKIAREAKIETELSRWN